MDNSDGQVPNFTDFKITLAESEELKVYRIEPVEKICDYFTEVFKSNYWLEKWLCCSSIYTLLTLPSWSCCNSKVTVGDMQLCNEYSLLKCLKISA